MPSQLHHYPGGQPLPLQPGNVRHPQGMKILRAIVRELASKTKANASIDWTIKETVRAATRAMAKRLLRKYGYPPDKQEAATVLVLEQAEAICSTLAA